MPRKQLPYGNTDGALTLDQVIGSLLDEEVVIEADTLSDLQNGPAPTAGRVAEVGQSDIYLGDGSQWVAASDVSWGSANNPIQDLEVVNATATGTTSGFGGGASLPNTVTVTDSDDLQSKVDTNGSNTEYVISGTHRGSYQWDDLDNVKFRGVGNATIEADSANSPAFAIGTGTADVNTDIIIESLTFDGRVSALAAATDDTESTTRFEHVQGFWIQDCHFANTRRRGINVESTADDNQWVFITNNRFTNNDRDAIFCGGCTWAVISGNYVEGVGDTGIDCGGWSGYAVSNNVIDMSDQSSVEGTSAGSGIFMGNVKPGETGKAAITGNTMYQCKAGVVCRAAAGATSQREGNVNISGNTIYGTIGSAGQGVRIGMDNITVQSNVIRGFSYAQVRLHGGSDLTIRGNDFRDPRNTNGCIFIPEDDYAVENLKIVDNYFDAYDTNATSTVDAIAFDTGQSDGSDDVVVRGNVFRRANWAVRAFNSDNWLISENVLLGGVDNGIELDGSTNSVVWQNYLPNIDTTNGIVEQNNAGTGADNNTIWENVIGGTGHVSTVGSGTLNHGNFDSSNGYRSTGMAVADNAYLTFGNSGTDDAALTWNSQSETLRMLSGGTGITGDLVAQFDNLGFEFWKDIAMSNGRINFAAGNASDTDDSMTADPETTTESGYIEIEVGGTVKQVPFYDP